MLISCFVQFTPLEFSVKRFLDVVVRGGHGDIMFLAVAHIFVFETPLNFIRLPH